MAAVQIATFHEPYPRPSLLAASVTVAAVAAVSLAWFAVERWGDARRLVTWRRWPRFAFAVDGALLSALSLSHAFSVATGTFLVLLLLGPLGAFRLGRRGVVLATLVVSVEEVLRQALRIEHYGLPASWDFSAFVVLLTTLLGMVCAWLLEDAGRAADDAVSQAERADRAARDLDALHRVIVAGIGGSTTEALERMTAELQVQMGYPVISVGLMDGTRPVVAAIAGAGWPVGAPIPVDPGGPLSRVLAGADAHVVGEDEIAVLRLARDDSRSAMIAPVRSQGRLLGHVLVESPAPTAWDDRDARALARIGDQMGLVIDAARAFEREADVAHRYRELDRIRRDFIAITSHELRTPLTAILGFAETLERRGEGLDAARRSDLVAAIARQAGRLAHVVDDLRTIGRLDAGALPVRMRAVPLRTVVEGVLETTGDVGVAIAGGPAVDVAADPERLHQILVNLVRNAFEHGEPPVELTWSLVDGEARISVRDHGPGVPAGLRDRVFERFVQGGETEAHSRGSGLGLSIARELAEAMGGSLAVLDAPAGACFELRLTRAASRDRALV